MKKIKYLIAKVKQKIFRDDEAIIKFFRKNGISIGGNCKIYSNILTTESYLISIGNNVTFSNDIQLITHDNSISKLINEKTDIFGGIKIGDNCFIGARSTIMYGVELTDNIIVAAGSVVTKSFKESNIIIGGNPAKKISDWESFKEKTEKNALNINFLSYSEKEKIINNEKILIKK